MRRALEGEFNEVRSVIVTTGREYRESDGSNSTNGFHESKTNPMNVAHGELITSWQFEVNNVESVPSISSCHEYSSHQ